MDVLDELDRPYWKANKLSFLNGLSEKTRKKVLELRERHAAGRIKGWPMKALHEFACDKLGIGISLTTFYRFMDETPSTEEPARGTKEQGPSRRTRSAAPVRAAKARAKK